MLEWANVSLPQQPKSGDPQSSSVQHAVEIKIPGVNSRSTQYHSSPRDSSGRHSVAIAPVEQSNREPPAFLFGLCGVIGPPI
ncbi:hypothetical protein SprV_0100387500 [Sparganum proliferum]